MQAFKISDFYSQWCLGQIYQKMQKEIPDQFWVTRDDTLSSVNADFSCPTYGW